jgi:hypothetical protein
LVGNYVIRQHQTSPIATKANALNDISFAFFDLSLGFLGDGICYYFQRQNDFFDRIYRIETLGKVEIDQPQVGPKGELSGSERVNRSAAE